MTFRVGQKVVCIGVAKPEIRKAWVAIGATYPELHEVYTIREIIPYKGSEVFLLKEISNAGLIGIEGLSREPAYEKRYFRPAVFPKVEVSFTTGADPDSEQHDNRRRIPVSEWGCSA